jgi:hypothetical protein
MPLPLTGPTEVSRAVIDAPSLHLDDNAACAVADLNGDKKIDVVGIGSVNANLKCYENR